MKSLIIILKTLYYFWISFVILLALLGFLGTWLYSDPEKVDIVFDIYNTSNYLVFFISLLPVFFLHKLIKYLEKKEKLKNETIEGEKYIIENIDRITQDLKILYPEKFKND